MPSATMSALSIDVLGCYSAAGKSLLGAYRLGLGRAANFIDSKLQATLAAESLPLGSKAVRAGLLNGERKALGFVVRGVDTVAAGAESTIDRICERSVQGIEYLSPLTRRLEETLSAKPLERVQALNLAAARGALRVATKVAELSDGLRVRVAGSTVASTVVRAKKAATRGTPVRRARKA